MTKVITTLLLFGAAIFCAPLAFAESGANPTLDQLCMNEAYAHHHRALCASDDVLHPRDYS